MAKRGRMTKEEMKYVLDNRSDGTEAIAKKLKRSEKSVQRILDNKVYASPEDIEALKQQIITLTAELEEAKKPQTPESPAFDPLNTYQRRSGAVVATEGASQLKTPAIPRNPLDYCRPAKP